MSLSNRNGNKRLPFFKWLFSRGQLKSITLLPFLVLLVLSFSLSWLVAFVNSRHAVKELMLLLSEGISGRVRSALQAYLAVPVQQNSNNRILLAQNPQMLAEPSELFPYFESQLRANPGLNILAFGNSDGEYVEAQRQADGSISLGLAGSRTGGSLELWRLGADLRPLELFLSRPDYDPRLRPWYRAAEQSGRSGWSAVYPYHSNQALALSANVPVQDTQGRIAGVLSATFTLNDFSAYLSRIGTGRNGFIIIFEQNGDVLATSLGLDLLDPNTGRRLHALDDTVPFVRDFTEALQQTGQNIYLETAAGRCLVSNSVLRDDGGLVWYTLVFLFEKDFDASIRRTNTQTAFLLALIFLIAILVAWLISSYISWPIIRLNQATSLLIGSNFRKTEGFLPDGLLARKDEVGNLARAFDKMADDLQSAFARLQLTLKEKEALLQEINHRVKNNLQLICSILNLQADRISDETSRYYFRVSQDRIQSLAMLHEEFYNSDDFSKMDVGAYLYKLRDDILSRYRRDSVSLSIQTETGPACLSIVQAVPFGLVFYELFSNAVKHAFGPGESGSIRITVEARANGRLRLVVCDSGKGCDIRSDLESAEGLGFTIIESLTRQLNGTISLDNSAGCCATLEFPII